MKVNKRHDELSEKFFKMGQALIKEGESKDDMIISSTGNFMVLISGLIFDEKDVILFGELCAMFSAKKVLEAEQSTDRFKAMDEDEIIKLFDAMKRDINDFDLDDFEDENEEDL